MDAVAEFERARARVKVVVLSGGVGGARFVRGLVDAMGPSGVTVIGNVGDDLEVLGLHVSPDLDTILYALAGLHDEERGWGRAGETWDALETVSGLGGEDWFRLGDRDLGLHLVRTEALRRGEPLSSVTRELAVAFGLEPTLLPATDDRLRTWLETPAGELLVPGVVRRARAPRRGGRGPLHRGARGPACARCRRRDRECRRARDRAEQPVRQHRADPRRRRRSGTRSRRRVPAVAVSPLIGGRAVKGPADRMLARLAGGTDSRRKSQPATRG